jgi:pre-mRNA-splicing helicase BRR2
LPPLYFVRLISDRWLHSEAVLPVSFEHLILPPKFPPPTELLDLQPLSPSALGEPAFVKLFRFKDFNPIQTQTFYELFKTDRNVLVCAASGSGKTICAEFAIIRMLYNDPDGKCVYVAPRDEIVRRVYDDWSRRFGTILKAGQIVQLTGDITSDLSILNQAKIILSSVKQWDNLSRRWRQRKVIQTVTLFIIDDLHFLGGEGGPAIEIMLSRMRYISSQKEQNSSSGKRSQLRLVGLGAPIANAREVGEWIGVPPKSLFNFSPQVRPTPLEIFFQSFDQSNFSSRLLAMAKPVYNAVKRHSEGGPALIFVPSRRQAQLTAIDMVTFRDSLDGGTFLGLKSDLVNTHHIRDSSLNQVVSAGVGFIYDGMDEKEWDYIIQLFRDGTLTVLVSPFDICWKIEVASRLVVIMDTEFFDGKERRYLDYPISNVLNIMGKASRPLLDSSGKCVILCHTSKKERLKKLLYDPLPIESHLDRYLHDHFNSEIVTKGIGSMQDAVDYITWTFLYRRLSKNPNYYNLQGTSNVHLSEHISEMVETVLGDLEESKCCQLSEEGEVSPLNLGMICAYYYVQYTTIELIASSVGAKTKTRGVLEILAAASEFGSLIVRQGDDKALKILSRTVKYPLPDSTVYSDANTKALVLLQCHFSRTPITIDLQNDQKMVLRDSLTIVQAIVDVISSNSWLKPALAAMEVSQMIVQGLWSKDNVLMQVPHFTAEIIQRIYRHGSNERVETVFDILSLDDDVRNDLLRLPEDKMIDVALFCNTYPNVDVVFSVLDPDDITSGDTIRVQVKLERVINDENLTEEEIDRLDVVVAPFYPKEKREGWWIVIGDTNTNNLFSLKKVGLKLQQTVTLEFLAPDPGDYNLTLFCMSDSYLGCDQEYMVPISVAAGEPEDYDEEEDDEELSGSAEQ